MLKDITNDGYMGIKIKCVEVSFDCGNTWCMATLTSGETSTLSSNNDDFAWVRWTHSMESSSAYSDVWCKATDVNGNTQPQIGIPKRQHATGGYLYNGYHRIEIVASSASE